MNQKFKFLCFKGIHNFLPSIWAKLSYSWIKIDLLSLCLKLECIFWIDGELSQLLTPDSTSFDIIGYFLFRFYKKATKCNLIFPLFFIWIIELVFNFSEIWMNFKIMVKALHGQRTSDLDSNPQMPWFKTSTEDGGHLRYRTGLQQSMT